MSKLEVVHKQLGDYMYICMKKLEVVHNEVGGCAQGNWRLYTRFLDLLNSMIYYLKRSVDLR